MEYEKHIKRLVLGYLKAECKSAYKVFLKYSFHNQTKHIATRVAGQSLEDILRIYSRVQETIQGRLEDTNYYKERSPEFSSPIYLPDQLLYLLNHDRGFSPVSSSCPRSPAESSVMDSHHKTNPNRISDTETTPEHSLPGNISSHEETYYPRTPFRRKPTSPVSKTPYVEKLPTPEKEAISEVMTQKLLAKKDFHRKLARNINSALNTPDMPVFSQKSDCDRSKEGVIELEETIKNAIRRTEEDPMFEDLLQDFLGTPIASTIGKAIGAERTTPKSSVSATSSMAAVNQTWIHLEEQNQKAVTSILSTTAGTSKDKPEGSDSQTAKNTVPKTQPAATSTMQTPYTGPMYVIPQQNQVVFSGCTSQHHQQQQQFYIVNSPMVIPQPQVMQFVQSAEKQTQKETCTNATLTEQDIMAMPIFLNDQHEIPPNDLTCFPPQPIKPKETNNIRDYLTSYNVNQPSPLTKQFSKTPRKSRKNQALKPQPTIKVEIYKHNFPLEQNSIQTEVNSATKTLEQLTKANALPNLNSTFDIQPEKDNKGTTSEPTTVVSCMETRSRSLSAGCTPSPLVTVAKKPTPKSGSHVRNLTFPSPLRKTPAEKLDTDKESPRKILKQQATKDLFKGDAVEQPLDKQPLDKNKTVDKENSKRNTAATKSPRKLTSKPTKKKPKIDDKIPKIDENNIEEELDKEYLKPTCCWDTELRKLIAPIIESNNSTPVRRVTSRKKSTTKPDGDITEAEGKKLEDALKTPEPKSKSSKKKKSNARKEPKPSTVKSPEHKTLSSEDNKQKKILSPSKLNASKRNILPKEIGDDVTPDTSKDCSQKLPANSKTMRNINSLLETPLKCDVDIPSPGITPGTSETPFTPMLKANLRDFTGGDTFSIDTPNFPVTPGFSIVTNTANAYYILSDSENNRATEAIVILEEKKSSVRKTDDEDVEASPKVYGSKEILDSFNKSRAGKKNLELLDNRGVKWDGSSDKEDKSDENSDLDEARNKTVIQNKTKTISKKSRPASGKSMSLLKIQTSGNGTTLVGENSSSANKKEPNTTGSQKDEIAKELLKEKNFTKSSSGSSSGSEIISKKKYDKKHGKQQNREEGSSEIHDKEDKVKGHIPNNDKQPLVEGSEKKGKTLSDIKYTLTTEEIRQAIACAPNVTDSCSTVNSAKEELEEKKKRVIELEKSLDVKQTPRRSIRRPSIRPTPNISASKSKRKNSSPRKVVKPENNEGNLDKANKTHNSNEEPPVDSQDEFFKKSGTNLHRKNQGQMCTDGSNDSKRSVSENKKGYKIITENKDNSEKSQVSELYELEKTWDTYNINASLVENSTIFYDESKPSTKNFEDYDMKVLKRRVDMFVPCSDGSEAQVALKVSPFSVLIDIQSEVGEEKFADSSELVTDCKTDDLGEARCGAKKRKHRSDSCNSNSSSKKLKASEYLNGDNIKILLTKLHGPSE